MVGPSLVFGVSCHHAMRPGKTGRGQGQNRPLFSGIAATAVLINSKYLCPPTGAPPMSELNPFDALMSQAQALMDAGRHQEALPYFDQALAIEPASAYAWFCRGCACSALGQPAEAARCYLESTRHKADHP